MRALPFAPDVDLLSAMFQEEMRRPSKNTFRYRSPPQHEKDED